MLRVRLSIVNRSSGRIPILTHNHINITRTIPTAAACAQHYTTYSPRIYSCISAQKPATLHVRNISLTPRSLSKSSASTDSDQQSKTGVETAAGQQQQQQSRTDDSSNSKSGHEEDTESQPRWRSFLSEFNSVLFVAVQFIGFLHLIRTNVVDIMNCAGPSMLPTMSSSGDILLVAKSNFAADVLAWLSMHWPKSELNSPSSPEVSHTDSPFPISQKRWRLNTVVNPTELEYARGDVIVASSPNNPKLKVCKRIIGLPGDVVCPPPASNNPWHAAEQDCLVVPRGHVWLQGDNLENSTDSRTYGAIPLGMIQGRVVWKLYPFAQFGPVANTLEFAKQEEILDAERDTLWGSTREFRHQHPETAATLFEQMMMRRDEEIRKAEEASTLLLKQMLEQQQQAAAEVVAEVKQHTPPAVQEPNRSSLPSGEVDAATVSTTTTHQPHGSDASSSPPGISSQTHTTESNASSNRDPVNDEKASTDKSHHN